MRALLRGVAVALALATIFLPRAARAEGSLRISADWKKFAEILKDGGASVALDPWHLNVNARDDGRTAVPTDEMKWIGRSPHMELVARDWGDARGLIGHVSLTDRMRLIRSQRMVVTRLRMADGRFSPFAQLGVGQWRVDTDLLPLVRSDVETAAQAGCGFQLGIAKTATYSAELAVEADYTLLYREQHEPQMIFPTHIWESLLAARVEF